MRLNYRTNETEIVQRLHKFANAYSSKNLSAVLACFSTRLDATLVVIAGAAPPIVGRTALEQRLIQEFDENIHLQLQTRWWNISLSGDVAWVTASSEAVFPSLHLKASSRFTAVLVKQTEGWFISHLHFSFPHSPPARTTPVSHICKPNFALNLTLAASVAALLGCGCAHEFSGSNLHDAHPAEWGAIDGSPPATPVLMKGLNPVALQQSKPSAPRKPTSHDHHDH